MYEAGWGKREIGILPRGYAMHGFGKAEHAALGSETALYARAIILRDSESRSLVFCCLDMGYVTYAMRSGAVERLRERLGPDFNEEAFILTCTHTHSGPGGCSHDGLYNLVTPGFQPEHLEAVITAIVASIEDAWGSAGPTSLSLSEKVFDDNVNVAWNRSLKAWNRNPDVIKRRDGENHLAIDRHMHVLSLQREGSVGALLSLFGVHATCVSSKQHLHCGDNKGYAAEHAEAVLGGDGAVAIFAQGTAGDVSPNYHGPGQEKRRAALKGRDEYAYAEQNGRYQSELALSMSTGTEGLPVEGRIDAVLSYVDFTAIHASPEFAGGNTDAWTSDPCHGAAFFAGTPIDGAGAPLPVAAALRVGARTVRALQQVFSPFRSAAEREYYRRLYAAQGPKDIVLEAGRKRAMGRSLEGMPLPDFVDPVLGELKRQVDSGALQNSDLVPTVLPLQIVVLGSIALVCCPGEFTTTAGRRLISALEERLSARGVTRVLICTYCNDYMGYVTTNEEYQEQAYEGGHTVYGQWTLAAFQTRFMDLAAALCEPEDQRSHDRSTRPHPVPQDELDKRSSLPPRG